MLSDLNRLLKELWLVSRILSLPEFIRWVSGVSKCLGILAKTKSLGALDEAFSNSFNVYFNNKKLAFDGLDFGVVREIYGHLCYAKKGELKAARHILDLGANGGAFTIFALTEAPFAKVHAVEAQSELTDIIKLNIKNNGYTDRAVVECAVVGGFYNNWTKSLLISNPQIKEFDIHEYISHVGTCDFLKCDVEGGEFPFFQGDLTWTQAVKCMVLEYHPTEGNVDELEKTIKSQGFKVERVDHSALGYFYCTRE
jgi:FkbM family methyltransferase